MSVLRTMLWLVGGVLVSFAVYYMLYRMTLPIQPFIYQAF